MNFRKHNKFKSNLRSDMSFLFLVRFFRLRMYSNVCVCALFKESQGERAARISHCMSRSTDTTTDAVEFYDAPQLKESSKEWRRGRGSLNSWGSIFYSDFDIVFRDLWTGKKEIEYCCDKLWVDDDDIRVICHFVCCFTSLAGEALK
jgi:hypothetical protein